MEDTTKAYFASVATFIAGGLCTLAVQQHMPKPKVYCPPIPWTALNPTPLPTTEAGFQFNRFQNGTGQQIGRPCATPTAGAR